MNFEKLKNFASWVLAGFVALLTAVQVVGEISWVALVIGLCLGLYCAPPVRARLNSYGVPTPPRKYVITGFFIALLVQVGFTVAAAIQHGQELSDAQVATAKRAEQAEHAKQEERSHYLAHKEEVLAAIHVARDNGKFADSRDQVRHLQTLLPTEDFAAELNAIDVAEARHLKDDDSLPLETRVKYYQMVMVAEPENASVRAKAKALDVQLQAQVAESARQQMAANRKAFIEREFSQWNGAHIELERALKETMKNPDSYEHVSTRYIDKGHSIIVLTKFRGTNSFGAIVPSVVRAEIDDSGRILSMNSLD